MALVIAVTYKLLVRSELESIVGPERGKTCLDVLVGVSLHSRDPASSMGVQIRVSTAFSEDLHTASLTKVSDVVAACSRHSEVLMDGS